MGFTHTKITMHTVYIQYHDCVVLYHIYVIIANGIHVCVFLSGVYDQRRIRNRWLVAYTLIRNPSLQNLTASNLRTHQQLKSRDLIETSSEASVQVHRRHVL